MDRNVKYGISLVAHNALDYTIKCVESILKYSGDNIELILCDNASTDETKRYFESLKDRLAIRVKVVNNDQNLGFILPQNNNLKLSNCEYFVVVNNDIEVCENWLETMTEPFLKNKKMALVGVKGNCCSLKANALGYCGEELEYIEASCMIASSDIIKKFGLFDDKVFKFGYCEDVDLSLRLREAGYDISNVDINIIHHRAVTSNQLTNIDLKGYHLHNHIQLLDKWSKYFKNRNFERKIIIKRKMALGDVILTTPIVHAIKEKYPHTKIDVWTDYPDVYANNPDVNEVFKDKDDLDLSVYDNIYDLDGSYEKKPNQHIIDSYCNTCEIVAEKQIYLYPTVDDEAWAFNLFAGKNVAIFHTEHTPGWSGRNLPFELYEYAAKYLRSKGFAIVELGLNRRLTADIEVPQTNFSQLCALIKHGKIFVGQDSALWHIAQAYEIPSIVPFGMIMPKNRIINYQKTHSLLVKELACRGCHHWGKEKHYATPCLREKVFCMENITKEDMKKEIDSVIDDKLYNSETAKCRDRLIKYCEGYGIDCGAGGDPVCESAISVDLPNPYANVGKHKVNLGGDAINLYWFKDNVLDYVFSSHLLEDFVDTEIVLREWLRVLKYGGKLIIYCPVEQVYRKVCRDNGQNYNQSHSIDNFSLDYVKNILAMIGGTRVLHENPLVDNYSFEIVVEKLKFVNDDEYMFNLGVMYK